MKTFPSRKPVHILCLEDNDCDRELLEKALASDGLVFDLTHAKNRQDFEAALAINVFDLIISDFTLPAYDGMTALATARKAQAQTPFIFLSGTITEEVAIESLQNGATDYVLKNRRDRLVSAVRRALRDAQQQVERRQLEEQLRQAQKMEAIGLLAGGVAHDFNNLLSVIQINSELALMDHAKLDPLVRENIAQIIAATDQAASLTRQLLAFGRKQAMELQPLNLSELILNLNKMLKRIIGEDISLQHTHDRHTPFVHADSGMIEQVLLNLVVNARDAMPRGGVLQISTRKIRVEPEQVAANPGSRPGEFICLRVRDTGCGMAPAELDHIFEPFFTTKEVGKGTGLGLATVYGIVMQHQGWLRVSSQLGRGSVFRIFLPAINPPAMTPNLRSFEPRTGTGTEKILLVEDDSAVRLMTRRLLAIHGYQVIEAACGQEALDIWRDQEATIDLLMTDMVMPGGITGLDLAGLLRKKRPNLKAVFVSGYSLNIVEKDKDFFKRANNHFLQKPYQSKALMEMIRRCLDETPIPVN